MGDAERAPPAGAWAAEIEEPEQGPATISWVEDVSPAVAAGRERPTRGWPDDVFEASCHAGNLFGDYILVQPVGSGGAGVVYRAWQKSLQRFVALKLLFPKEGLDGDRLAREARIAAGLSHPHLVPVYEVGAHQGRHYLTMKLVAGVALSKIALAPRLALEVMRDVAEAVDHAHKAGIVHRDLKPHNLLLEEDGHVWVTDFGVARHKEGGSTLTETGSVVGTPAYMPPEQARGRRCDERSDVYALGATAYHLLTGRPPFEGDTPVAVMIQQVKEDPVPLRQLVPSLHPEIETIVLRAMAKAPERRYPTAKAFAEDLERHLGGRPILASPPGVFTRAGKWVKRHVMVSVGLLCLAIVGASATAYLVSLARARHRAEVEVAHTLVAEANALGAAGRWAVARDRYLSAKSAFADLDVASAAPDLGLLDAYHHAPPPLLVLRGHQGGIHQVAFLPDGKRVLSASQDGTLRLWDISVGRQLAVLTGHKGGVTSVALSADGQRALSGGEDGTVRLWQLPQGTPPRILSSRGGAISKVALSPDGALALSRTETGVVQLWNTDTGQELRSFDVAANRIFAVAFSPDGRLALTGEPIFEGKRYVTARASLWEVETGRVVQTLGGFRAEVESLAFSRDGRRVVAAGFDQLVSLWDAGSGRRLLSLKGHLHGLEDAALAARDRLIVSGGADNAVKLWDAESGHLLRTFETGHAALALAVSPDGRFVLSGGQDATLRLWDLSVGQEFRVFSGHEEAAQAVAFSPDERLALSVGRDQKLRMWDVATGRELGSMGDHQTSMHALAYSPDGRQALTSGIDRRLVLWDLEAGHALTTLGQHAGTVRSLLFLPDGKGAVSTSERGEVKVWDLATGQERRAWRHGPDVRSSALFPDGRRIVTASFDGTAILWDIETGRADRVLATSPPERLSAVAVSADGRFVVTGSFERTVRLWDLDSERNLLVFSGHVGDVRGVRFSPDGERVYSASRDRTLRVWDRRDGHELHAFSWASDGTWAFALSPTGRYALAGNEDGSLNFWDFDAFDRYRALEAEVDAAQAVLLENSDDARALATLGTWYAFRGVCGWAVETLTAARAKGAAVSPLALGRCHWEQGDLRAAREAFLGAEAKSEAPARYLALLRKRMGLPDQATRLRQLSLRDGRIRYPFLGILSRTEEGGTAPGARVTRVFPDSPAALAGVRPGDLIVGVDHQRVERDADLGNALATRPSGTLARLALLRRGRPQMLEVRLGERPSGSGGEDQRARLREPKTGWWLETITPELAISLGLLPETRGVLIADTGFNVPAEFVHKVKPGDVLLEVEGQAVTTAEEAALALGKRPPYAWENLQIFRPGNVR